MASGPKLRAQGLRFGSGVVLLGENMEGRHLGRVQVIGQRPKAGFLLRNLV